MIGFYDYEIAKRQKFNLPPFSKFIALIISDFKQGKAQIRATEIANFLKTQKDLTVYGPINAPLFFLRKKYRYRILLKYVNDNNLHKVVKEKLSHLATIKDVNVKIDVDPHNFM